jgi:hypothetical protein
MKSKVLAMSVSNLYWMQEILEFHKQESVTLQSVFNEESCLIHNIYGGFKEKLPRIFMKYSPTLRTPKGGGHIPSVLKKNGMIYTLTPEEAEQIQGLKIGTTDLDV